MCPGVTKSPALPPGRLPDEEFIPARRDEGFSYMETIAALFIAAISASALAVLVLGLFRAPFTIRSGSRESASVALLDRELRLMAARIQGALVDGRSGYGSVP